MVYKVERDLIKITQFYLSAQAPFLSVQVSMKISNKTEIVKQI